VWPARPPSRLVDPAVGQGIGFRVQFATHVVDRELAEACDVFTRRRV
jgi:hypothetical protein